MKTLKKSLLTLAIAFISMAAFSQSKTIKITKPISSEDLTQVKAILDTFDPNSYSATIVTTNNKKYVAKGKGLESVSQITGLSPNSSEWNIIVIVTTKGSSPVRSANLGKLSAILSKY